MRRPSPGRAGAEAGAARLARRPPTIVRGPGTTVHAQIENWLADAIAVGQLAPGDRLPAEHDLAAWFGVSRMTLRHALGELAQRGLVVRAVGRNGGTFVAEPKVEQDLTTLAGFSAQLRRHGMLAGARVLAAAQVAASPVAAAALRIGAGDPAYDVRRIRLADGRPMVLEHSLFPAALFPGLLGCRLDGSLYELLEDRIRAAAAPGQGGTGAGHGGRPRGRGAGGRRGGAADAGRADRVRADGPAAGVRPRPVPRRPDKGHCLDIRAGRRAVRRGSR